MKIAIVGASGFIGLRAVEWFTLGGRAEVRAVVRGFSSLAVLARQELDWRVADPLDAGALAEALKGCDVVLHAAIGDPDQIERMAESAVEACRAARVGRLVWLSSASVHGQAPASGTDETAELRDDHPFPYANAKVRAERTLAAARDFPIVRLRPGVVHGPRSRWLTDAAREVHRGKAWWVEGGRGVCNSIYVDNLLEAARLACTAPGAPGEAFLIGDAEKVSWRDFLLPIAEACGGGEHSFQEVAAHELPGHGAPLPLQKLVSTELGRSLALRVPDRAKRLVKSLAASWPEPAIPRSAWSLPDPPAAQVTAEVGELMLCRAKLPNAKAASVLGYQPPVSFAEGLRRGLAWLEWTR